MARKQRRAFISYKRTDSSEAAASLFDQLNHSGYTVFLDTASVEKAATFQDVLNRRLSDMDVLLLLDSENIADSEWVEKEITHANHLGLGVMQIVWPGKSPLKSAQFSKEFQLKTGDFVCSNMNGKLRDATLDKIYQELEGLRIQSLASRRRRIVDVFTKKQTQKFDYVLQPTGAIEILSKQNKKLMGVAFAQPGYPDGFMLYEKYGDFIKGYNAQKKLYNDSNVKVLYDGLGVQDEMFEHLEWLNEYLRIHSLRLDQVRKTKDGKNRLVDPAEEWLCNL